MNATPLRCLRRVAALALLVLPLVACSKATTVSGRVVRGEFSFIGTVDPADPRLKAAGAPGSEGLEGAEISVRGTGNRADRILSDARSGKSGEFTARIDDQDAIGRPTEFRAHLAGYV